MQQTASTPEPSHRAPRLRAVPSPPEAAAEVEPSATATRFAEAVRTVVALSRRHRLRPPVFRSPPRLDHVDRSIRRRPNGTVVVAVRRSGRPLPAVQADVIEGVVAANGLEGAAADRFRHEAWAALQGAASRGRRHATMEPAPPARVA